MGFTQLVRPYFAPLNDVSRLQMGQFAWIPVPNLESRPHVLEAERIDERSHSAAKARWVPVGNNHFKRRRDKELPILSFHLNETEELLCYKAKKRPAIVIARFASIWGGLDKKDARPHHEEDRVVFVPIYGIRSDDDPNGFGPVMHLRVRHLVYQQYFPIDEWKERRAGVLNACSIGPGVARFDRLQFLMPDQSGVEPIPLKLSDEAFKPMRHMLWAYFGAKQEQDLIDLRQVLREYLPPEAGLTEK